MKHEVQIIIDDDDFPKVAPRIKRSSPTNWMSKTTSPKRICNKSIKSEKSTTSFGSALANGRSLNKPIILDDDDDEDDATIQIDPSELESLPMMGDVAEFIGIYSKDHMSPNCSIEADNDENEGMEFFFDLGTDILESAPYSELVVS